MFISRLIYSEAPCTFLNGSRHMFQPYFANLSQILIKDLLNMFLTLMSNNLFHVGAHLFCFFKIYLFILESREGREEGRERNINVRKKYWLVASNTPTRDQTHNPGMCPDQEWNLGPFPLRKTPNPLSHISQGRAHLLEVTFCFTFSACSKWICLVLGPGSICSRTNHPKM